MNAKTDTKQAPQLILLELLELIEKQSVHGDVTAIRQATARARELLGSVEISDTSGVHRFVYTSTSRMTEQVETQLLEKSSIANQKAGIAGAMLISKGRIVQCLEGRTAAIEALVKKIKADPRHNDFTLLLNSAHSPRMFESWSYASSRINPKAVPLMAAEIKKIKGMNWVIDSMA